MVCLILCCKYSLVICVNSVTNVNSITQTMKNKRKIHILLAVIPVCVCDVCGWVGPWEHLYDHDETCVTPWRHFTWVKKWSGRSILLVIGVRLGEGMNIICVLYTKFILKVHAFSEFLFCSLVYLINFNNTLNWSEAFSAYTPPSHFWMSDLSVTF